MRFVLSFVLFMGLSSAAFAQSYQALSQTESGEVTRAIHQHLTQVPRAACIIQGSDGKPRAVETSGNWIVDAIRSDSLVQRSSSGQPLLRLESSISDTSKSIIFVTTDSTETRVVRVDVQYYQLREVNRGTLTRPDFIKAWVPVAGGWTCEIK